AITDGVRPTVSSLFPPAMGDGERRLRAVLDDLGTDGTARVGELLAPFGIRYVVVQQRLPPLPYDVGLLRIDPDLAEALDQQLDLSRIEVAPGLQVYENLARRPVRSTVETG